MAVLAHALAALVLVDLSLTSLLKRSHNDLCVVCGFLYRENGQQPWGLTGKYVTIFCSKSQAESEFKTYFYRSFVITESRQRSRISITPVEDET